jgi:CDP-paratose 2-epimerase
MRVVVTGGCGFVGSALARRLVEWLPAGRVTVFDNLRRAGAETNRDILRRHGIDVIHGDARCRSDVDALPACDWFIDAAAEPSVLAGTTAAGGRGTTSRQLVEHNLWGTVNLLEAAAERRAGFVMLSTSRVYAIEPLARLPLVETGRAFRLDSGVPLPAGAGPDGVSEAFATAGPVSLYGATKLASETLAIEYAVQAGTPLFINRCGVMAGAGQFGRADQGIFSWWIHSWAARRPLRYIGFGGRGLQVRDCLHPDDLALLITAQLATNATGPQPIVNVSGGLASATSLAELSAWCAERFGPHEVAADPSPRPNDIPWLVLDHGRASQAHAWQPAHDRFTIFEEIAAHADAHPDWLDRVAA